MGSVRYGHSVAALVIGMMYSTAALAQTASQPSGAVVSNTDIVVTAQKRSESINDVPMTITAFSGDALAAMGVSQPDDLAKVVPSLTVAKSAYGAPIYTLRGVGFFDYTLAATPTVTVYVDEVPLPYTRMGQFAALDLERVEVLKGPQGTLYGVNATGGAINFIAASPTPDFSAGVDLSYGRFNEVEVQGFVSGPITPTLGARLSVSHERADGWQRSYTRDDTNGRKNITSGRLLLDWEPTSDLSFRLNLNAARDRSDSVAAQFISVNPLNAGRVPPLPTLGYPVAPRNNRAADWDADRDMKGNNRQYQAALTGRYDLSDTMQLVSITSYIKFKEYQPVDSDGTSFIDIGGFVRGSASSFYQELRLLTEIGDRGSLIFGGNYQSDKLDEFQLAELFESAQGLAGARVSANTANQRNKTFGIYGHGTWELSDSLEAHAGIRYTSSKKSLRGCTGPGDDAISIAFFSAVIARAPVEAFECATLLTPPPNPTHGLFVDTLKEDNISWTGGLKWEVTPDTMLYGTVSQGYKAGSYPLAGAANAAAFIPVPQEKIVAFETGVKSSIADRLLQFNGALFYYDYSDKQTRGKYIDPSTGFVSAALVSVPKAEVYGFEAQFILRPTDGLDLDFEATYAKSKITESFRTANFLGETAPGTSTANPIVIDYRGEPLPYAPKWSVVAHANYETHVSPDWLAFAGADFRYQSDSLAGLANTPLSEPLASIDAFHTIDLRAGVKSDDGKITATIWGRNITNEYYWNNVNMVISTVSRFAGMPRTYGVSLSYRY